MTITPDQARELLDGATPGPWKKRRDRDGTPIAVVVSAGPTERHHIMTAEPACSEERAQADTGLIAAAPDLAQTIAGMTEEWGVERDRPCSAYIDGTVARWTAWIGDEARARKACAMLPRGGNPRLVRRLVGPVEVTE